MTDQWKKSDIVGGIGGDDVYYAVTSADNSSTIAMVYADKKIDLDEASYNAELIVNAPKLLELLTIFVNNARYPSSDIPMRDYIYSAAELCCDLIKQQMKVSYRKDKYVVGDVVKLSPLGISQARLVNGYITAPFKSTDRLTVIEVRELPEDAYIRFGHTQTITVKDNVDNKRLYISTCYFEPIIRDGIEDRSLKISIFDTKCKDKLNTPIRVVEGDSAVQNDGEIHSVKLR